MTAYAIDKVIRTAVSFRPPNGDQAIVVLHFASPATCIQVDVNAAASAIEQLWTTVAGGSRFREFFCTGLVLESATARTLDPTNPLENTQVYGLAGTGAGLSPPAESSIITSFYTDLPTRRGRGRAFWPGYDASTLINGAWTTTNQNEMNVCLRAWQAAIPGSDGIEHVVWSKVANSARTVGDYFTRGYLGHQRRRRA